MKDLADGLQLLVPFLQQYPLWVKGLVVAWIFITAIALVGLLFFRNNAAPTPPHTPTAASSQKVTAPSPDSAGPSSSVVTKNTQPQELESAGNAAAGPGTSNLTMIEYFSTLERLRDRYLENDEFIQSLQGKRVTWSGYVDSVKGSKSEVTLFIVVSKGSHKLANVRFPQEFRTKLFSLQAGDEVTVSGVYKTGTPSMPDVEGDSIEVNL